MRNVFFIVIIYFFIITSFEIGKKQGYQEGFLDGRQKGAEVCQEQTIQKKYEIGLANLF